MTLLEEIRAAVIEGDKKSTLSKVQAAVDQSLDASIILNQGLISAMQEVGRLFEEGEYFVPEMLVSARAMSGALQILKPYLVAQGTKPIGKVAIGTVQGDLHDIGKNLVGMMLEGSGLEIVDLGVDVAPEKFIEAIQNGAQVIAMSALLTTTMSNMKTTIDAIQQAGLRDKVTIVIGGAPVTQAYAEQIGADGYSVDASSAVRKVHELLGSHA